VNAIVVSVVLCSAPPVSGGSEAFHEMTLMDAVNLVRYHRRIGTLVGAVRFAQKESKRHFPKDPQWPNGKGNAFKHALWSATLCAEIDEKSAKRITDGHEDWPRNPVNEKTMDLHNNKVGISVGGRLRGRSRTEIADAVMNELRDGKLRYLKGGRLIPTNE
jgi:hypothetical protein